MPLFFLTLGLIIKRRYVRIGRGLVLFGLLSTWLLSSPFFVAQILAPLENVPPLDLTQVGQAQAVVILGGGRKESALEYGGETVNGATLERVRYGARVAKKTGLPVLVTGGAPTRGTAEAVLMARALEEDFDLKPRWLEVNSLDTGENARMSATLLHAQGVKTVVLVTHASHMRRAMAEFRQAGFQVLPAPTSYISGSKPMNLLMGLLPDAKSAYAGWVGLHEWLGLLSMGFRREG